MVWHKNAGYAYLTSGSNRETGRVLPGEFSSFIHMRCILLRVWSVFAQAVVSLLNRSSWVWSGAEICTFWIPAWPCSYFAALAWCNPFVLQTLRYNLTEFLLPGHVRGSRFRSLCGVYSEQAMESLNDWLRGLSFSHTHTRTQEFSNFFGQHCEGVRLNLGKL